MSNVIVTDRDGVKHELTANPGESLMEVLRDAGLPIEAICGGQSICSTCHIYVDEMWAEKLPAREEVEPTKAILEAEGATLLHLVVEVDTLGEVVAASSPVGVAAARSTAATPLERRVIEVALP